MAKKQTIKGKVSTFDDAFDQPVTRTKRKYTKKAKVAAPDSTVSMMAVRSVGVTFDRKSKVYHYLVDEELQSKVKVSDRVVVMTPFEGLTLVQVVSVSSEPTGTKYIVDHVDVSAHEAREATAALKQELIKKLAIRKGQIDENRILDLYAKEDKEFAALLAQLRDLN